MRVPSIISLAVCWTTTQAFVTTPLAGTTTHLRPLPTHLSMTEEKATISPAIAKRSDLAKGPAKKMDEAIFNFNKFLIDSVYDLICLVYPVKGTERDFARFYVLETVARVPYFAYLSVLHLREVSRSVGADYCCWCARYPQALIIMAFVDLW